MRALITLSFSFFLLVGLAAGEDEKGTLEGRVFLPGNLKIKNIAVVITPLNHQIMPTIKEFVIEIKNKTLHPHCSVITVNQEIRICNSKDNAHSANHNIYSPSTEVFAFDMGIIQSKDTVGKVINPSRGKRQLKTGVLSIYGSMYESIEGHYLIVSKNKRGQILKSDGIFVFDNLKPGPYKITVWQKDQRFNNFSKKVTLPLKSRLQLKLFRPRVE
jgi:hypothetical protein